MEEQRNESGAAAIDLSVIVPVYNMEKYLARCLDSLATAETLCSGRMEALLINDGSTDASAQILGAYARQYTWMKVYQKENGGLSDVKNYGLARARGAFVTFLDSDDYILPEMYVLMLRAARRGDADVVVCDVEMTYDDAGRNRVWPCTVPVPEAGGRRDGSTQRTGTGSPGSSAGEMAEAAAADARFRALIFMSLMPASWNKVVRRGLYEGLTFPVGKNNEDIAVTPVVLARARRIETVHVPFYKYYQRPGSIQNSVFDERRFVILETAALCLTRLEAECGSGADGTMRGAADGAGVNTAAVVTARIEAVRESLYVHQMLEVALYTIRAQESGRRGELLRAYFSRITQTFPDFWDNAGVRSYSRRNNLPVSLALKKSLRLLREGRYEEVSRYWERCPQF